MNTAWLSHTRQLAGEWVRRLWLARGWCTTQVVGLALLLLLGIGWTRIAEKHWWQVLLTLLIPLLLLAALLLLQAGTVRSMTRPLPVECEIEGEPVSIAWGAATLLLWVAVALLVWWLLDKFDDQITPWSGYLNSKFGSGARAKLATEDHIAWLLNYVERALRWVILPGMLVPLMFSAQSGLRKLPWSAAIRVWLNWRWWPGVLVAALVGVAWPVSFFTAEPHGSVTAQVWRVMLKVTAGYLFTVASWVALLAWAMTLFRGTGADMRDDSGDLLGVGVRLRKPGGDNSSSVRLPLPESSEDGGGHA